jgi:hypothetical protein
MLMGSDCMYYDARIVLAMLRASRRAPITYEGPLDSRPRENDMVHIGANAGPREE